MKNGLGNDVRSTQDFAQVSGQVRSFVKPYKKVR
jgi:hypothetical protein